MKFSVKSVTILLISAAVIFIVFGVASGGLYQFLKEIKSTPVPEAQFEETSQGVKVKTEDESFAFKESDLPDNFPPDFPVFEKAVIEGSWSTQGEEKEGMSVIWKVEAPIEVVVDYYQEALVDVSWQITSTFEQEEATTLTISKDDYEGFIGIAQEDEKVVISVTLGLPNNEL